MCGMSPAADHFSRIVQATEQMVAVKIKNLGLTMGGQIRRKIHLQAERVFPLGRIRLKLFKEKNITQEYKWRTR